ncbi:MAG: cupin domain-containing protein [Chloroflexi bacterium]|nr:cupin domain-containing protein [Chloroflexota bacterium]
MKMLREINIEYINNLENASKLGVIVGLTAPILKKDYSIAITRLGPSGTVIRHYHVVSDEVYLFIEGSCIMKVNSDTLLAQPGTVVVIESGDWHEILPCEDVVSFYALSFPAFKPEDFLTEIGE